MGDIQQQSSETTLGSSLEKKGKQEAHAASTRRLDEEDIGYESLSNETKQSSSVRR